MAHPYHHALSSVKQWGGQVDDYFRHRALRHHAEGIFLCEKLFGVTITISSGREIPVRWIGEQHVKEDLGRIPSASEWLSCIHPEHWMMRGSRLDVEFER